MWVLVAPGGACAASSRPAPPPRRISCRPSPPSPRWGTLSTLLSYIFTFRRKHANSSVGKQRVVKSTLGSYISNQNISLIFSYPSCRYDSSEALANLCILLRQVHSPPVTPVSVEPAPAQRLRRGEHGLPRLPLRARLLPRPHRHQPRPRPWPGWVPGH